MAKASKTKIPKSKTNKNAALGQQKNTVQESPKRKVRKVRVPKYKSFRISKRIRQPKTPVKKSTKLFVSSLRLLYGNWRFFGGIILIYSILTVLFVKGTVLSSDIGQLKGTILGVFHNGATRFSISLALFDVLLRNVNSTSGDIGGTYQFILLIIFSLLLIWGIRISSSGNNKHMRIKDAFYKAFTPLATFLIVFAVIMIQLLPLIVANYLYIFASSGGLAESTVEKSILIIFVSLLSMLSLYMVLSSIFALYIVTLPNVTPLQALRSARELARNRRWLILRKILFLPLAIFLLAAIIIIPLIIISPTLAEIIFFILSMLTLPIVHSYLYKLYRELI